MKITYYGYTMGYRPGTPKKYDMEINCKGMGTETDPYVIDSSVYVPNQFEISVTDKHLRIQEKIINSIKFTFCANVKIKNCSFKRLVLLNCENMELLDSKITMVFKIKESKKISVINNSINKLKVKNSNNCYFKENKIDKILTRKNINLIFD